MESVEFDFFVVSLLLAAGFCVIMPLWITSLVAKSRLRREVEDLKKHLHLNMTIHAKGTEEMQRDLDRLKQENEHLRTTIATLSNKPGRAELKLLHTWERAIKLLILKSPSFAPAWEMAIEEASREVEETTTGMKALVRKAFLLLPQTASSESADS